MRNRLALTLVAALSLAAGAQELPAARVLSLTGSAEVVQGMKGIHPARATERVAPGSSLNLGGKGKLRLSFYGDGHVEEVTGPCLVRVESSGCKVVHGGSGCLARIEGEKRVLVVSQGGNLQSVGGAIAGISDPATSQVSPRASLAPPPRPPAHAVSPAPPPPPPPPPPDIHRSSPMASAAPGSPMRRRLPEPEPLAFKYTQKPGTVVFDSGSQDLTGVTAELADGPEKRALAFDGTRLVIPGKPGDTVVVEISRNGRLEQKLPVRFLTRTEESELKKLLEDKQAGHAAIVVDRLDQLGLPFLAAARAEALLVDLHDKDAGLLTYLFNLYSHELSDPVKADRVSKRAADLGLTLP